MYRASCNILYYNYIYNRTVGTNYLPVHYNRGSAISNWTNDRHGIVPWDPVILTSCM